MGRIAGWAAVNVALLAAAGAFLPLRPELVGVQLGRSFAAVLHFEASVGGSTGTRLISTFGPLGFLFYNVYLPDTFVWLVVLRAFLGSITWWALAWIGYAGLESPWSAALLLFVCGPLMAASDVWLLILPLLAVFIELPARKPPPLLRVAVGVALGLAALIKVTCLITVLAVVAPLTLASLINEKRIPPVTLAAAVTAAIVWTMTGRGGADLIAFLDYSLRDIVPGYSSAMQLPADPALALHAAGTSIAVFAAGAVVFWQRWRGAAWPAVLGLAGITFLLFKAGFVRADTHVYITAFGLLVIAALLAVSWGRQPLRFALAAALVGIVPVGLLWHSAALHGTPLIYFRPIHAVEALQRLATAPIELFGSALAEAHARRAEELGELLEAPLRGPVDVYSFHQGVLIGTGADYRPRPVFQSYMAYTPRLARANADFLLGPHAPPSILFKVQPIDGRLPALDDAASWPILLSHYRVARIDGGFAVLQRSAARPWRLEPIERIEARTGVAIAVPRTAQGLIWARIDVGETFADVTARTLLAAPLMLVDLSVGSATPSRFRLVPSLARDGFLLSPLVRTTSDFLDLFQDAAGAATGNEVASLTVGDLPLAGERAVVVEFFRLVVEPAPSAPNAIDARDHRLHRVAVVGQEHAARP